MSSNAIEAFDLGKSFGEVRAVDGVSFSVPYGSVLGLLGPNGAGKTTTVRMLTTLTAPTHGRATVDGCDVVTDPVGVRASMGLTGQAASVDELLTGRENLRLIGRLYGLSSRAAKTRADELLEKFSLTFAADRVVRNFSGGMRRRLDLASSLVAAPKVLFLDEPTTGLDPRSRLELWVELSNLVSEGMALLLTTQYLDEVDRLADDVVVIDKGSVIAQGTSQQLKDQLGSSVVKVTLSDSGDLDAAHTLVAPHGSVSVDETAGVLTVTGGVQQLVSIAASAEAAQISLNDIGVVRPSLDDVFLQLTGDAGGNDKS